MGFTTKVLLILVPFSAMLLALIYKASIGSLPFDPESIREEGGNYIKLRDGRILEYFENGPK